jgi:hypothetical protein
MPHLSEETAMGIMGLEASKRFELDFFTHRPDDFPPGFDTGSPCRLARIEESPVVHTTRVEVAENRRPPGWCHRGDLDVPAREYS